MDVDEGVCERVCVIDDMTRRVAQCKDYKLLHFGGFAFSAQCILLAGASERRNFLTH